MKRQEYRIGNNIEWINCNGEFKTIDEMSFKQRLNYRLARAKDKVNYAWRRHLAGNRSDNSRFGLLMTGMGSLALLSNAENGTIGGMLFGLAVASYGVALVKARRKGGTLDKLMDALNKDEGKFR